MDFAIGLLARVSEGQKKAAAAEKRRAAAEAAARRRAAAERAQREKERAQQEVSRLMARNRPKPRMARRAATPKKKKAAVKRKVTAEEAATRLRAASSQRSAREVARERQRKATGPPKPMKGMEFVARRDAKKEIRVPHTSDYSDLFGDEYLKGIDLKCVTKMKEESARASKEAEKIHREREAIRQKRLREAEEIAREAAEMKKRGVNQKETNEWRRQVTQKDWVSVDVPKNTLTPRERAKLEASSSSPGAQRLGVAAGSGIAKVSKAQREAKGAAEIAKKKAALRQSILAATGGAPPPSRPQRERSVSRSPERRPLPPKRKRVVDDEPRSLDRRSWDNRVSERRSVVDRRTDRYSKNDDWRSKKPRHEDRYQGYNSDEWDDDGDDDDSDEDLFGIDALDREEEESARQAALEDRREIRLEAQRRKEKARRREEFEKHN